MKNLTSFLSLLLLAACANSAQLAKICEFSADELVGITDVEYELINSHASVDDWLDMFADDAYVNDPVGTPLHTGKSEMNGFFKVFLDQSTLEFAPHVAFTSNTATKRVVMKYVDITATTIATGVASTEPAILLYEIDCEGKITVLEAYWDLNVRLKDVLSQQRGAETMLQLSKLMLEYFKVDGTIGYGLGVRTVNGGKEFLVNAMDINTWTSVFAKRRDVVFEIYTHSTYDVVSDSDSISAAVEELSAVIESVTLVDEAHLINSGEKVSALVQIKLKGIKEPVNGVMIGTWKGYSKQFIKHVTSIQLFIDTDFDDEEEKPLVSYFN